MGVDTGRQEHRLQRLGRRQQDVGRIDDQALTFGWTDVTVPQPDPGTDEASVAGQAEQTIVEQGSQGTQVEGAEWPPSLGGDSGEHRQDRRFRLAAGGWRQEQGMVVTEDRIDRIGLQWAQRCPTECVDDVVLQ